MRILNEESSEKVDFITIYLERDEMEQLKSYTSQLLDNPDMHHLHFSSEDFKKEITLCIYDKENLDGFDERSKKLILEDE